MQGHNPRRKASHRNVALVWLARVPLDRNSGAPFTCSNIPQVILLEYYVHGALCAVSFVYSPASVSIPRFSPASSPRTDHSPHSSLASNHPAQSASRRFRARIQAGAGPPRRRRSRPGRCMTKGGRSRCGSLGTSVFVRRRPCGCILIASNGTPRFRQFTSSSLSEKRPERKSGCMMRGNRRRRSRNEQDLPSLQP